MDMCVSTDLRCCGLEVVLLQNDLLKVEILPEAGAKVWQITYMPLNAQLLWNNPQIDPTTHTVRDCYDDVWSGGWDELFPNDEEAFIAGKRYPDHGELWSGRWEAQPFASVDEVGVKLRFRTPVSSVLIEKTITLRRGSACVFFSHRLTNEAVEPFPFLWKLHPAFAVSAAHRIDFPPMRVVREMAFSGTLETAPEQFEWPYATVNGQEVDLRNVPGSEQKQLHFFYGTGIQSGWCAITNAANRLSCGLRFDPQVFSCCWLFGSYGGWRDLNVAVLEPCTGYPLNFDAMMAAGREKVLAPGETMTTEVIFSVQPNRDWVSYIDENGIIVQEADAELPTREMVSQDHG